MRFIPFIWKEFILDTSDHCNPYKILLFNIDSKTLIFHYIVFCALSQNSLSLLHIESASAILF